MNGIIKSLEKHYVFKTFTKHEIEDGFFDEYYDSEVDSKCYWECDREEFDNLKIGDELDENTFVVSIDRTPAYVYEYNFITESWREI